MVRVSDMDGTRAIQKAFERFTRLLLKVGHVSCVLEDNIVKSFHFVVEQLRVDGMQVLDGKMGSGISNLIDNSNNLLSVIRDSNCYECRCILRNNVYSNTTSQLSNVDSGFAQQMRIR